MTRCENYQGVDGEECLQIFSLGLNVLFLFSIFVKVSNFDSISEKHMSRKMYKKVEFSNTLQDLFIHSKSSLKWMSNLIILTSNKYDRRKP